MDKIINLLINNWTKGVDTYTHNGSTWLIFTEQKSWVIELTESKTLWYNYNFFKELFSLTSMDVVENQHYITKWVEDNIINGVKHTEIGWHQCNNIDDAIEYGVKETLFNQGHKPLTVKNIIENGVRHTLNTEYMPTSMVEDIIENGVKETKTPGKDGDIMSTIEWMEENKSTSYTKMIDDVIENGVKETKVCNFLDPNTNLVYVRWPEDIEEVIDYGTKNPSV